jgi:hypothetical protein
MKTKLTSEEADTMVWMHKVAEVPQAKLARDYEIFSRGTQWAGYEYIFKEPFEPTIELTKDGIIDSGVYVRRKIVVDIAQDRVNAPETGQQTEFEASTSENRSAEALPNKASTSKGPGRHPATEQSKRQKASVRQARWRAKKAELLAA